MNHQPFHARPVQLVSQVCGALHAPVGDAKLIYPCFAESDRDGGGGPPCTEEQDALAREFYAGFLAGHHHPASVRVETAQPVVFDHHGVDGARDAGALVQLVHERDHRPLVRHRNVEAPELQGLQAPYCRRQFVGIYIQADVDEVEAVRGEGCVVHSRAQTVADGLPDEGQQPGLTADPPSRHAAYYRGWEIVTSSLNSGQLRRSSRRWSWPATYSSFPVSERTRWATAKSELAADTPQ